MFRGLGKFFGVGTDKEEGSVNVLPEDVMDLIQLFSQNLQLLETFENDKDKASLLTRMIMQFETTFSEVKAENLQTVEIKESLQNFCSFCGNYGALVLLDRETSNEMFKSLSFVSNLFGSLPNSKQFINLFLSIVQNSKNMPDLLEASYGIITVLFTSMPFFFEFVEIDGFSLVFSSFFMEESKNDTQLFWINLLFSVVPDDFFSTPPSDTILDIFIDTMKSNEKLPYDQCITFIASYIAAFFPSNNEILDKFDEMGGFKLFGDFIMKNCPSMISNVFNEFLAKTNISSEAICCLHYIYTNKKATPNIRHSVLECILSNTRKYPNLRNKIFNAVPLSQWFMKPPEIDKDSIENLIDFSMEMVGRDIVPIQEFLPQLLVILTPPVPQEVPTDKCLELISKELIKGKLQPDELVDQRFLEDFVLLPTSRQLAWCMSAHPSFTRIITSIYSAQTAQEFRFPIIQAFISASQYLSDMPSFVQFLSGLFTRHFSAQIVHLLLNFLSNADLVRLLTDELAKRQEAPDFFCEANGPKLCIDFVEEYPDRADSMLKLIATAATFGQRPEVDNILNELNPDHPIFSAKPKTLSDACFAFRSSSSIKVPSLIPYVEEFDTTSPANAYMIGKYGVKAFEKRGTKLQDIPGIANVINRYVEKERLRDFYSLGEYFDANADCFSLIELQQTKKPAVLRTKFGYSAISFWFKVISSMKNKQILISSLGSLSVQVSQEKLVFSTPKEKITASIGSFENEWVNVCISFSTMRSASSHATILVNGLSTGIIKLSGEQIPVEVTFGDTQGPMNATVLISSAICSSNYEIGQNQATLIYKKGPGNSDLGPGYICIQSKCEKSAVYVGFMGISSYFTSLQDFESFFEYAENCETFIEFKHALLGLISLRQCVKFKVTEFYTRLCFTLKRKADLISQNIAKFIEAIPYSTSTRKRRTKALSVILSDVELFNILSSEAGDSFLKFVTASLGAFFDVSIMEKRGCFDSLIAIMRSGVDIDVSIAACPVIGKLIQVAPTEQKIRSFLNIAVSSSEWSHGLPFALSDFPISSLLTLPLGESRLQISLLNAWTLTLKMNSGSELLNFNQLIDFMILFEDERALIFAEVICYYSQKNPQFAQSTKLAMFAFSRLATIRRAWSCALEILSALPYVKALPQRITIERNNFCPVILEMLSSLMESVAHAAIFKLGEDKEISTLASNIFTILATIPDDQYAYFISPNCIDTMYKLSNFGMVPKSLSGVTDGDRIEDNWFTFSREQITKDDIKSVRAFIGENEYTDNIFAQEEITKAQSNSMILEMQQEFPFDCLDSEWFNDLPSLQYLASFFASILFASEPTYFTELLQTLYQGNSLMYGPYRRRFGNELVSEFLIKLAGSDEPYENYHKSILLFVLKCICEKAFENDFIHIISLVLNLVKSLAMRDEFQKFFEDQEALSAYREILLSSFVFVPKEKLFELFQLLAMSKNVVFDPIVFDDSTFGCYWMHLTKNIDLDSEDLVLCMSMFFDVFGAEAMSDFNPEEIEIEWEEHSMKFKKEPELNREEMNRIATENIIKKECEMLNAAIAESLKMNVYRTANIYVQANISMQTLNQRMRSLERSFFRYSRIKKTFELKTLDDQKDVSYHLSSISLPMYQPRVVLASPFKVKCPAFDVQASPEFFAIKYTEKPQRVKQLETNGEFICCPELCYFHEEGPVFTSPFEYSKVIVQSPKSMLDLFYASFPEVCGAKPEEVGFYHYIHEIPSLLFISEKVVALLILAQCEGKNGISLIKEPPGPIAFLPFTESIALCEWSASLFCGHVVLLLDMDSLVLVRKHLFVHKPVGLNIYFFMQPALLLSFKNQDAAEQACKILQRRKLYNLPNYPFLFTMQNPLQAMNLWMSGQMTSFDYLLVLNSFGGRSFSDLAQYPVFPWVISPELEPRDLSLPMGQLDQTRASHFDQTFELSSPKYFYGFHYSLPGAVFWLMMRLPPFTFFGWDLNCGWDDPGRLFFSIQDAYTSASSKNPSDLKELIPEMYSIPEAFINSCGLTLPLAPKKRMLTPDSSLSPIVVDDSADNLSSDQLLETNNGEVELPDWCPDPYSFIDVMRKTLELSPNLNDWIDLIFGYKQSGEQALLTKNIFLPTSYHTATAEDLDMDEAAFEAQVLNFGQCPIQLFVKPHPGRYEIERQSIALVEQKANVSSCELKNPLSLRDFKIGNKAIVIPTLSTMVPPSYSSFIGIQGERIAIHLMEQKQVSVDSPSTTIEHEETFSHTSPEFAYATDISCSEDGMFCAISFSTGLVRIHRIIFESSKAVSLKPVKEMRFDSRVDKSCVVSSDFIAATSLSNGDIVLWNVATGLYHRIIHTGKRYHTLMWDSFDCVLTCVSESNIYQYTINGHLLRQHEFEFSLPSGSSESPLKMRRRSSTSSIGNTSLNTPQCLCACPFYIENAFDGRLILCGFADGIVQFFCVDSSSSQLKQIGVKAITNFALKSVFCNPQTCEAFFNDARNKCFTIKATTNTSVKRRCIVCNAPQTTKCSRCGAPLCDGCNAQYSNLCPSCSRDLDYLSSFRF